MSHKIVHVPENDEPETEGCAYHTCKPMNDIDRDRSAIGVKHRSIAECKECGQYWWAKVYGQYNSYSGRVLYHLEWYKLRWYHFELRKYVR